MLIKYIFIGFNRSCNDRNIALFHVFSIPVSAAWALGIIAVWALGIITVWALGIITVWALGIITVWALGIITDWTLGIRYYLQQQTMLSLFPVWFRYFLPFLSSFWTKVTDPCR